MTTTTLTAPSRFFPTANNTDPFIANSAIRQRDRTRSYYRSVYIDSISSPRFNLDISTGATAIGIVWDGHSDVNVFSFFNCA
ncbi:hypothetical protein K435DRAFT_865669 [Dendrothele bispora CBS 962.96]|uniref:Uncharacterized protein n=1 Tax=Dendrothele bispora (strain CBS 962.96) TaxID=1314807 RepID=A0A4S8LIY1_DENBC|nr:hypothetical protein K435DRAFT_865669 [Dendrothele bispora CBS 962.96]